MAVDLTAITVEVADNTTVAQAVVTLLHQIASVIANIPPSIDPQTQAALDALKATLQDNDKILADAVIKCTQGQ